MTLLDALVRRGLISEADKPRAADAVAGSPGKPPHFVLLEKGFLKEEPLYDALADEFGLEYVDLTKATIEQEALVGVPQKLVHRRNLMPLARNNGTLIVATGDPYDAYALDELHTLTGLHVHPVLGSPREIARLLKTHFGVGGETVSSLMEERKEDVELL